MARSIAANLGLSARRCSTASRARYLAIRNDNVAPMVAPISANKVPCTSPKSTPPTKVRTEPGIKATVAATYPAMKAIGPNGPSPLTQVANPSRKMPNCRPRPANAMTATIPSSNLPIGRRGVFVSIKLREPISV